MMHTTRITTPGTHAVVQSTIAPDGTTLLEVLDPYSEVPASALDPAIEAIALLARLRAPGTEVAHRLGRSPWVGPVDRALAALAAPRLAMAIRMYAHTEEVAK